MKFDCLHSQLSISYVTPTMTMKIIAFNRKINIYDNYKMAGQKQKFSNIILRFESDKLRNDLLSIAGERYIKPNQCQVNNINRL